MTDLLGITIYDPDVVVTDVVLAILGGYLGWRLGRASGRRTILISGALLMGGLASAALWGAIFHAFFPAGTATFPGFLAWIPVTLSIVIAASVASVSVCNPLVSIVIGTLLLDERLSDPAWHKVVAYCALGVALFGAVVISLATEGDKEQGAAPVLAPAT